MRTRLLSLVVGILATDHFLAGSLGAQQLVEDPLTLFAKMMPVLSHDRCVNCHGATNPFTGDFHPGSVSRTAVCSRCHTANPKWNIAPTGMEFYRKTTR